MFCSHSYVTNETEEGRDSISRDEDVAETVADQIEMNWIELN